LVADESYLANIKFSQNWSQYPDSETNGSEISNDTQNYKELMIVGNKSGGANRRVGIWDELNVHGKLSTDQFCIGSTCLTQNDLSKIIAKTQ